MRTIIAAVAAIAVAGTAPKGTGGAAIGTPADMPARGK